MSMQGGSKGRRLFRALRWVALSAAVPALWACTSRTLEPPTVTPVVTDTWTFRQTINRDVDLLFLIDDSRSMEKSQANLLRNCPQFMQRLEGFEGGLPNVQALGALVKESGARSWVYRFMLNGKARDIGLGPAGPDGGC